MVKVLYRLLVLLGFVFYSAATPDTTVSLKQRRNVNLSIDIAEIKKTSKNLFEKLPENCAHRTDGNTPFKYRLKSIVVARDPSYFYAMSYLLLKEQEEALEEASRGQQELFLFRNAISRQAHKNNQRDCSDHLTIFMSCFFLGVIGISGLSCVFSHLF